ncbi:MAG: DNA polymerase III subunit [Ruminococcaceae bacterium]|nr:DNA polymerase III subunit [Oscillospiraceae bacterium]
MGFQTLLGNDTLKQRLRAALGKNKASHCYLITGPSGSGKHTLAKLLAAAMQCTQTDQPCCVCPQCRKALEGQHPDVIAVDDAERVTIPIKLVRDSCADLYLRPNEGKRKIYLFPRGQALRADAQNTLLKCIEEPPSYGAFIFLCEHSERMLQTIRSRCVELRLSPLSNTLLRSELTKRFPDRAKQTIDAAIVRSGGYLGQALELLQEEIGLMPQSVEFVRAFCADDAGALLRVLAPMEKLKRDQLKPILAQWYQLLTSALSAQNQMPAMYAECESIASARSPAAILNGVDSLKQAQTLLDANVSPAHVCGMLAVRLQS